MAPGRQIGPQFPGILADAHQLRGIVHAVNQQAHSFCSGRAVAIRQSPRSRRLALENKGNTRSRAVSIKPAATGAERISRLIRPLPEPRLTQRDWASHRAGV